MADEIPKSDLPEDPFKVTADDKIAHLEKELREANERAKLMEDRINKFLNQAEATAGRSEGAAASSGSSATEAKGSAERAREAQIGATGAKLRTEAFARDAGMASDTAREAAQNSKDEAKRSGSSADSSGHSATEAKGSAERAREAQIGATGAKLRTEAFTRDAGMASDTAREAAQNSKDEAKRSGSSADSSGHSATEAKGSAERAREAQIGATGAKLRTEAFARDAGMASDTSLAAAVVSKNAAEDSRTALSIGEKNLMLPGAATSLLTVALALEKAQAAPAVAASFDAAKDGGTTMKYSELKKEINKGRRGGNKDGESFFVGDDVKTKDVLVQWPAKVPNGCGGWTCVMQQGYQRQTEGVDKDGLAYVPKINPAGFTARLDKGDTLLLEPKSFAKGQRIDVTQGAGNDRGQIALMMDKDDRISVKEGPNGVQLTINGNTTSMNGARVSDIVLVPKDGGKVQDKAIPLQAMLDAEKKAHVEAAQAIAQTKAKEYLIAANTDSGPVIDSGEASLAHSILGGQRNDKPGAATDLKVGQILEAMAQKNAPPTPVANIDEMLNPAKPTSAPLAINTPTGGQGRTGGGR